jgi:hypothetical protein
VLEPERDLAGALGGHERARGVCPRSGAIWIDFGRARCKAEQARSKENKAIHSCFHGSFLALVAAD